MANMSPEEWSRKNEREADRALLRARTFEPDIERAALAGQVRGLGPFMAQQRLRKAQLEGEMGPSNYTFGEPQTEEESSRGQPMPRIKNYAKGGKVSSASSRADGCAQRGKTKGRYL